MTTINKRLTNSIYLFFFLSGMSGLIYQVLWAKYLSNIFGSSAYAHTIVLAVFMGGLAFGNFIFGRIADRLKTDLLYLYGLLEVFLGIYCMLYPNMASGIEKFYHWVGWNLNIPSTHKGLLFLQFALNGLTIFAPTTLMGGTLPIMVKFITKKKAEILNKVSILYFINSGGAVLGSLICGFFLIRLWGLDLSITIAAIINIAIGVVCLGISKRMTSLTEQADVILPGEEYTPLSRDSHHKTILILFAIAASGFASMLYEIMWIRTLIQFFGSSVYSFSIVVAAFIGGITLGSAWLAGQKDKIQQPFIFFGTVQAIIALSMYFCVLGVSVYASWIWRLHQIFNTVPFAYPVFLFSKFLMAFIILLIPSFFIGMTLPLASSVCSQNIKILGREVGGVFSANTLGALLGTIIAGLVFLPQLGIQKSFNIGIVVNALIALSVFVSLRQKQAYWKCAVFVLLILFLFISHPFEWQQKIMLTSMFRYRLTPANSFQEFLNIQSKQKEILFYKEGLDGNVAIVKDHKETILFINGKPDASSKSDMPTQLLSGHLPGLIHKNPKKALVIGFGSGVTVGALTLHPTIERVDCLEISKAVIEAGEYFKDYNHDALHNKKVNIIIDDAKNFLSFSKEKYDIIVSEPTNPWTAGTGSLMTQETFARIKDSLKEGGIFLQWFHAYEMTKDIFKSFGATLTSVFPRVSIWKSVGMDYFFISGLDSISIDVAHISHKISANEGIKKSLAQVHADNIFALLTTQVVSEKRTIKLFYQSEKLNKDRYPTIEFNAPRAFFLRQNTNLNDVDERLYPYDRDGMAVYGLLNTREMSQDDLRAIYHFLKNNAEHILIAKFTWRYIDQLSGLFKDNPEEKLLLEKFKSSMLSTLTLLDKLEQLVSEYPDSRKVFEEYLQARIQMYKSRTSMFLANNQERQEVEDLMRWGSEKFSKDDFSFIFELANFYQLHNEYSKAYQEYEKIIEKAKQGNNSEQIEIARLALLAVMEMSLEERNPDIFSKSRRLAQQHFPTDTRIFEFLNKGEQMFRHGLFSKSSF